MSSDSPVLRRVMDPEGGGTAESGGAAAGPLSPVPLPCLEAALGGAETAPTLDHGPVQPVGPEGKEPAKKWPYRGDIDGLRAVAVVAVVLFHFGVNFRGGFTGVDVFFVISGYLITSIQLGRLQKGTFSMREFWARRVRRLFWACAVMLAVVVVAAHYVFLSADFQSLLSQMTAVQLFGANFHYYLEQPYFFDHLEAPLLHCWSLAVEEQYYMLYPFLLRCMWWCTGGGDRGRHALLSSLVVIFIASLALSIAWSGKTDSRGNYAFYLLPARAWEMALGGLLVPLDHWRMDHTTHARRLAKAVLSWVGVGMIVASFWLFSAATPYPGSAALLPCLGTSMFIVTSSTDGEHGAGKGSAPAGFPSAGRLLALAPVAYIGKLSYSLYVWHWPVFVLLAYSAPDGTLSAGRTIGGLCASAAAAVLSYHFVENTSRNPQIVPNRIFWPATLIAWASLLLFARLGSGGIGSGTGVPMPTVFVGNRAAGGTCNTFGGRLNTTHLTSVEIDKMFDVPTSAMHLANIMRSEKWSQNSYALDFNGKMPYVIPWEKQRGRGSWAPVGGVVLIGDSHCLQWGPLIEELALEYGKPVTFICRNAFHWPSGGFNALSYADLVKWSGKDYIAGWKPNLVVFMLSHQYLPGDMVLEVADVLSRSNTNMLLVGDIPAIKDVENGCSFCAVRYVHARFKEEGSWDFMRKLPEASRDARLARNTLYQRIAAENPGRVSFADIGPYYINNTTQSLQLVDPFTGRLDYKDGNHVNDRGSRRAEQFFRSHVFGDKNCSGSGN